ncbi:MAG: hypothetical protein ABIN24_13920 [Dyadobacter sp.]
MLSLTLFLEIAAGVLVIVSLIPLLSRKQLASRIFDYSLSQKLLISIVILLLYCTMLFAMHSKPNIIAAEFTLLGVYTSASLSILLSLWQKK